MMYSSIRWIVFCVCMLLYGGKTFSHEQVVIIVDPGHGGRDQGGYNGRGFPLGNTFIPEDAYTYDVAKRIEWMAIEKGWHVFFTVVDPEPNVWEKYKNQDRLLPRKNITYNKPHEKIIAYNKEEGLQKRVDVVEKIQREHKNSKIIFISLHFDYASPVSSGPKLLTPKSMARHPFLKILARNFEECNLPFRIRSKKQRMIHQRDSLFILRSLALQPRVLIELGNFNDNRDRSRMLTKEGREIYARIIISALNEFISERD